jgi:predicted RecB family nuclease
VAVVFVLGDGDGGRVVYSASDLAAAARCEYALLRAFDAKLGRGPAVSSDDELLARTSTLGDDHERRQLEDLRAEFGTDIAVIGRPTYHDAGLRAAFDQTMAAVERRFPVVYQAAMYDGRFVGFADFLVLDHRPDGDRYRLRDTKLARSVKVEAMLQLAAYADALARAGVPVADEVELVLGNGAVAAYRVEDLLPVYLPRRAALQRLLDEHLASDAPVAWEDETVRACFRCPECEANVRAGDDLLLVAGMRVSQRARLLDAGLSTVHELAEFEGTVPELSTRTVKSLVAQARLQVADRVDGKPPYEVADAQPLMVLPEVDKGDLFFDFEGDPLWTLDGQEWGLEYLWGVLTVADEFTPFWAHDRASERQALVDFLAMVRKRLKRYPNMHVYHYAAYEKSTLLRLAGRYGVGENDVDDLLRNGVLVDLYPLVRKSIRVGTESYSIKYLEPLYMGTELRSGEVTTATDSITQYAKFCALRDADRPDDAAVVLKEIEDYNRYDCRSTRRLRDWLILRAIESSVPPRGPQRPSGTPPEPAVNVSDQLERKLMAYAGDGVDPRTPEQTAVAMIAAARGYHRREDKPFWWAHFDRVNNPIDEWSSDAGVFVAESAEVVVDWHKPPRAQKMQRHVRLVGELASGELNVDGFALYDPPSPAVLTDDPDRRAAGKITVLEYDDPETPTAVLVAEKYSGEQTFDRLPFAVTPGAPLPAKAAKESIEATAALVGAGLPNLPADAVTDILLRRPPRTLGGTGLPDTGVVVDDITAALLDLDSSYVAVHGPPGTGKTYTSAQVIARLVNAHGWRVGVVAQSHAVVENLLDGVVAAEADPERVGKKRAPEGVAWCQVAESDYASFIDAGGGCVIGGTTWDFANERRVPRQRLDLLVVEEAGQFSLANTIAVASSARNLLLLGDPQQLPQVSQGTHPEPVDHSALGWLVSDAPGGHHTLPRERGYFLDLSYRMHPDVCRPVSRLSYDGRLRAKDDVSGARHLDGVAPGVRVLEIDHAGNSTDSPEEAAAIVAAINRLLGTAWTDESGTSALDQTGFLVVTPYNAQVVTVRRHLDAAGLRDVQAGTVDKFQGRQAPVVFVSMTASSADDVPRGISFLLNRNRLNVAVSRAKYLAVLVRSAHLTDYLPSTPAGLVDLGAFLALSEPLG